MRHIKFILAILVITSVEAQELQPSQLKEDFNLFKMALVEAHPGLYRYTDSVTLASAFKKVDLDRPMSTLEFYRQLNPLVALIGCGHTKLHPEGRPDDPYAFFEAGLFPLRLFFRDGRVEVIRDLSKKGEVPAGALVTAINGLPIQTVVERLKANIFSDGYVESAKYEELNRDFAGYYATFFGSSESFEVSIQRPESGSIEVVVVEGLDLKDIRPMQPEKEINNAPVLSYPERGVAILKIPVFMPSAELPDFQGFLARVFREIRQNNVEHLILDLRDNQGGIDAWGKQLYAYLTDKPFEYYDRLLVTTNQPYSFEGIASLPVNIAGLRGFIREEDGKFHFTLNENLGIQQAAATPFLGNLYILQNGRSFSVTSEFAAKVCDDNRATFIGQENGGAIEGNNSGAFAIINLPNSKLTLGIPLVAYYMKLEGEYLKGRGVIPDYPVEITVEDIISQRDAALETALLLCKPRLSKPGG